MSSLHVWFAAEHEVQYYIIQQSAKLRPLPTRSWALSGGGARDRADTWPKWPLECAALKPRNICGQCGAVFDTAQSFSEHLVAVHLAERNRDAVESWWSFVFGPGGSTASRKGYIVGARLALLMVLILFVGVAVRSLYCFSDGTHEPWVSSSARQTTYPLTQIQGFLRGAKVSTVRRDAITVLGPAMVFVPPVSGVASVLSGTRGN